MSRRRPLHTCGASFLAVIHTACRKAQELNGPLGKWAKRITKFTSLILPLIYLFLHQWLAILSFTDDCILKFEKLVETIFPPSSCLFDKIDMLVYTAENMPGRFDEVLNRFLVIIHRAPFLDWVLMQIIWWPWPYGNQMEEKEIMVDMNSNTKSNVTESADVNANCPSQEKIFVVEKPESNAESPPLTKSAGNKEKSVSFLDSIENEVKTDNAKYTAESSAKKQFRDLNSAPLVDSSLESANHSQLPSTAVPIGRSSKDRRKSVRHAEFAIIADPPDKYSSEEKRLSVDHGQFPSISMREEHRNKILEDETTKSVGVKLESDIVKGDEKITFGKQRGAENTPEGLQQSRKDKDPVLDLFESRWLL